MICLFRKAPLKLYLFYTEGYDTLLIVVELYAKWIV
jgi:hypothetical protein